MEQDCPMGWKWGFVFTACESYSFGSTSGTKDDWTPGVRGFVVDHEDERIAGREYAECDYFENVQC